MPVIGNPAPLVSESAWLACTLAALLGILACQGPSPIEGGLERRPPLSPDEALRSFRVADGFRVELAASEPEVVDPIAIAFDEAGRMFAAEMRGYPYDTPPSGELAGRIRLLQDKDADGRFESSSVFADGLHWPSGIACWDGGIFVTAAPDILYFKDTDGDGAADIRRTVFTGFGTDKSEDIVNNLRWGPDQWIYGTTSYNGGTVRHAEKSSADGIPLGSSDFRFHPVTEVIEAVSGTGGDFGNAFDDWGNRFASNAGNPIIHAVFPLRHVTEGWEPARLAAPSFDSELYVYPISEPEPWRVARKTYWSRWGDTTHDMRSRRFPPRELALRGYYTGGAGLAIYRGATYPRKYHGNAFAAEPAGNLVLRLIVERSGVTVRARRAEEGKEFLASTDNWFRPVNITPGPDGCLYIVDMYREVIEDPSAIPEEILEHIDYYSGQHMGRIYRIVPDTHAQGSPPRLEGESNAELVALLGHEDGWWRGTAQRLLFERGDADTIPALESAAGGLDAPQGRLSALWVLESLGKLDDSPVMAALEDRHWAVRRTAVRLAEPRLAKSESLRKAVISMAEDDDASVRFQVALAAQSIGDGSLTGMLASILRRDPDDYWVRAAVLAAARRSALALLKQLLDNATFVAGPDSPASVRQLAASVASNQPGEAVHDLLEAVVAAGTGATRRFRVAALSGVAAGLERAGSSLPALSDGGSRALIGTILDEALLVASDREGARKAERIEAIRLLASASAEKAVGSLGALLSPDEPPDIQLAAVRALAAREGRDTGRIIVSNWRTYSPAVRREALEALLSREERLDPFLDALEDGEVRASQLDPTKRQALLEHRSRAVRSRARRALAGFEESRPEDVIRRFQAAIETEGNQDRGAGVFERECATCHRLGAVGHAVGPDLLEKAAASREELLVDILDPNRTVQSNFVNYRLDTVEGAVATGILWRESDRSVTLRRGEGVEEFVERSSISSLTSMGLSLMPEGLGDEIDQGEMADLLAFIQSRSRPEQANPGD